MDAGTDWNKLTVVVLSIGLLGKIVFDWLREGRIKKKAIYMEAIDCQKNREKCCVTDIKKDVAILQKEIGKIDLRVGTAEKSLDKGDKNFNNLRADIGKTNILIAGLVANMSSLKELVEHKIDKIVIK